MRLLCTVRAAMLFCFSFVWSLVPILFLLNCLFFRRFSSRCSECRVPLCFQWFLLLLDFNRFSGVGLEFSVSDHASSCIFGNGLLFVFGFGFEDALVVRISYDIYLIVNDFQSLDTLSMVALLFDRCLSLSHFWFCALFLCLGGFIWTSIQLTLSVQVFLHVCCMLVFKVLMSSELLAESDA